MRRAIPVVLLLAAVAGLLLLARGERAAVHGPVPLAGGAETRPDRPIDPPPPAAVERRVGVLVLDARGAPAGGAVVDLIPAPDGGAVVPAPIPLGTTDASGRLPWPDGALPFPGLVRALHPERGGGDAFAVSAAEECTVRLLPPLTLRGVVLAADGSPIAGAAIEAQFEPALQALGPVIGMSGIWVVRGISGGDGSFVLRGLPPAVAALLTARREGWTDAHATWNAVPGRIARIVMHRPFRAVVRVLDESQAPLDGATVVVQGAASLEWRGGFAVRESLVLPRAAPGEYSRGDLPPGWYRLLVVKPGYESALLESVALHPARDPVGVVLGLAAGVDGVVVDAETGVPVPGASIQASPSVRRASRGSEWESGPLADAAGDALVARSGPDGKFRITVAGPGSSDFLWAVADGYLSRGGPIETLLRGDRLVITLFPRLPVTATGRTVTAEGSPVGGALLTWARGSAATGADGRFRLEGFRDGMLFLFAQGFDSCAIEVDGDGNLGDIVLRRLRTLRGVVVEAGGAPVAGLPVAARLPGKGGVTTVSQLGSTGVSDDDGGVALSVPGEMEVVLRPVGQGRIGQVTVPASGDGSFRLVVSADELADAGSISGRLLLPDGKAPEGVGWVLAKPEGAAEGTPAPAFEADPGGEFLAPRLRPGRWTLSASTLDGFRGELPGVVLPPNGSIRVEIRLEPAPPPTEKPPPTIEVEVRPEPPPAPEDAQRLRAWATSWRGTRSVEARRSVDGPLRVAVREAEESAMWVVDAAGKRAGVAGIEAPSADRPVEVHLVPAGWIVLPPDPDALDRWVVLRDARDTPFYSGFEANLPAVAGEGYRLPVPPGEWSVTLSRGIARRHPRVLRVIVAPGSGARAE